MKRKAVKAGSWYERSELSLRSQIERAFVNSPGPGRIPKVKEENNNTVIGIVAPHAGYTCSAPYAAYAYLELVEDSPNVDTFVVIGPNHTGDGEIISVWDNGEWETPLGNTKVDEELASEIINLKLLGANHKPRSDTFAHLQEHSIEIQIPFIQYCWKNAKIVPICVTDQSPKTMMELGRKLAEIISNSSKSIRIVASSDFTHFKPHDDAKKRDLLVINNGILKLDPLQTAKIIYQSQATVCGPGGIFVLMTLAKMLNYSNVELLEYGTSGNTCGGRNSVVGYAAIAFKRKE